MKSPRYYSDEFHGKTFPIRFMIKNQVFDYLADVDYCTFA